MPSLHLFLGATTAPNYTFILCPHSSFLPSKTLTPKNPKPKPPLPSSSGTTSRSSSTSSRGGVGKTTNNGLSLARLGFFVVAIDADVSLCNLDLLLGFENHINIVIGVLNGD
ncbi:Septum site-determining protein MinD [Glycine max]|nr:Septum site-determining protein MinD [Glycine max]